MLKKTAERIKIIEAIRLTDSSLIKIPTINVRTAMI
jgi:hypothetical protein